MRPKGTKGEPYGIIVKTKSDHIKPFTRPYGIIRKTADRRKLFERPMGPNGTICRSLWDQKELFIRL